MEIALLATDLHFLALKLKNGDNLMSPRFRMERIGHC